MAITVEEALQLPELKETKLVAGSQGNKAEIKWITILEIIEDISRIHEGEFLITTGYSLNNRQHEGAQIIANLAGQKLSGVAVHTGFYIEAIPQSMIDAANQYGLPLIEIPKKMNFSQVTRVVLEKVVNSQMKLVSDANRIHDELTSLVLQNYGMATITRKLAKMTDARIRILDKKGEKIDEYPKSQHPARIDSQPLAIESNYRYPILVDEKLYGFLNAEKNTPFSQFEQLAMRQATTIYAIEFLKIKIVADTKQHLQGDFLDDLLQKGYVNEQAAVERAHQLGYELAKQNLVMLVQSSHLDRTTTIARDILNQRNEKYMIRQKSDHIVILYMAENDTNAEQEVTTLCSQIIERFKTPGSEETDAIGIGTGNAVHGVATIADSARQARYALLFSQYMGKELVPFSELGAYQLFIQLKDNGADLAPYYMSVLGSLIQYDGKHHSHLIQTFEAYVENNLRLRSTADVLFIHRHTLTYRLEQIKKKTGKDVHLASDRTQLHLAVMAYRMDQMLMHR